MGMANIVIDGRLGRDPEIKETKTGSAMAVLAVANSDRRQVNREWTEVTQWYRVLVFGKRVSTFIEPYFHKGDSVLVAGKLVVDEWTTSEGEKRITLEIRAAELEKIGGSGQGKRAPGQRQQKPQEQQQDFDDELPF